MVQRRQYLLSHLRPSLENRELSPVPDIVSPTSPILSPTSPPAQAPPPASSRRSSLPSPHRPGSGSREASPRKREVEVDQEENLVERRAGLGEGGPSATLGRRRSRIPQPRHQGGGRLGRWETNGYYFQALENFVLSGQQVSLILAPIVWMRD